MVEGVKGGRLDARVGEDAESCNVDDELLGPAQIPIGADIQHAGLGRASHQRAHRADLPTLCDDAATVAMDDSSVRLAIIAGGKGTRMQDRFGHVAKTLVPLAGRPVLQYQLDSVFLVPGKEVANLIGAHQSVGAINLLEVKPALEQGPCRQEETRGGIWLLS